MIQGQLSSYFSGVAVKRLSAVETMPAKSNQHEFNGSGALRRMLGEDDRKNIPTKFIWLGGEQEAIATEGSLSWYDARRRHPTRTEYRLYYPSNRVTAQMESGDVFFLALRPDGSAMVIVVPVESTIQNQLLWLFELEDQPGFDFIYHEVRPSQNAELDYAARYILDELGVTPEEPEAALLDGLIEDFGTEFPSTRALSDLARSSLPDVSAADDPDLALVEWIDREVQLFKRLERKVVADRLSEGFQSPYGANVDGFLSFSLSVQNRRKARAGQALEHHLEAIFSAQGIRYSRGAETENRNRPDFLFPGQREYLDSEFPATRLTMLGAKSSLKDRWRQVLSEAERIQEKHLLTLEPGISENQTTEMQAKQLQLVVPRALHSTFRLGQQQWLMDVSDFIALIRSRQDS